MPGLDMNRALLEWAGRTWLELLAWGVVIALAVWLVRRR
jgi:hypothetical protein